MLRISGPQACSISNSPANRRGAAHGGGVRYGFIEAPRQLHAERLRFTHPTDGSAAQINAPLPGESEGVRGSCEAGELKIKRGIWSAVCAQSP